jgi:hypothetical protein
MLRLGLTLLACLLTAPAAHAWGDDGHRIVGQIAWDGLTPTAREAVAALLPRGDFDTLADAATWPDVYARTDPAYAWANPRHYVSTAPGSAHVSATDANCADDGTHGPACVVGAIAHYAARLQDRSLTVAEHVEALRFLAHFVGDLHMPLHVFHPDGRGGTLTSVRYRRADPKPIHMVWDVDLIATQLAALPGAAPTWADQAARLEVELEVRRGAVDAWRPNLQGGDLRASVTAAALGWADESYALALRDDLFGFGAGDELPRRYDRATQPLVDTRLQQAGVRLAAILNAVYG